MQDLNTVVLVGRLTRDGEVKYTSGGLAITSFSLASNRRTKQGDEWKDEASFFDVTMFGKFGEAMAKHLTKGQQVAVSGRLQQDRWQDKDGGKRSKVIIVAETLQILGSAARAEGPLAEPDKGFKDDIPF